MAGNSITPTGKFAITHAITIIGDRFANAAADIKAALEARIAAQKKAFENYQPKEMDKLNSPVLTVQGKYVFMCISDDNAKAEEIIG